MEPRQLRLPGFTRLWAHRTCFMRASRRCEAFRPEPCNRLAATPLRQDELSIVLRLRFAVGVRMRCPYLRSGKGAPNAGPSSVHFGSG